MSVLVLVALLLHLGSTLAVETACYGNLGCLSLDQTWYESYHRPFNVLPETREDINTTFLLITSETLNQPKLYSNSNLKKLLTSPFNPKRPTKIIVHGFLSDTNSGWMKDLALKLLVSGDYNVFLVDWGSGASPPYYQATANTRLVGLEIANLVNTLTTSMGARPEDFHIIGHSLGAHTAGYAGERIPNLGKITGLDPAGPYFRELPEFVRLDPSDANFVEAIHTDGESMIMMGFGMTQPLGHIDFYPNGGVQQPGCSLTDYSWDALNNHNLFSADMISCNHHRATELYIDSIGTTPYSVGYECRDYDAFLNGECGSCGPDNSRCAKFGLDSHLYPTRNRTNVNMYFVTKHKAPFALYHYLITVNTSKPASGKTTVYGSLVFTVIGSTGKSRNVSFSSSAERVDYGTAKTYLLLSSTDLGQINEVQLYWRNHGDLMNPSTWCVLFCYNRLYVSGIEISQLNHYPESQRLMNTYKTCPSDGQKYTAVASAAWGIFSPCSG